MYMEQLILNSLNEVNSSNIGKYLACGGYKSLEKAFTLKPVSILEQIQKSRLTGRSSAFSVATKWSLTLKESSETKYVVCDADEGEPGTFKDRMILLKNPHLIIEAMIIAGYTVGSHKGYFYIRGEYLNEIKAIEDAINQAREKDFLGNNILGSGFGFDIEVYRGAGSYVVGEETALLRSMAGLRPSPGTRPPYPVTRGFLGKPTVVNNVETLANIPFIIEHGGDWYSELGNPDYPGTKLFCLSGHVNRPGVYELPLGVTLDELINRCGNGVKGKLKAILPGGIASGFVNDLNIKMDYKNLLKVNSLLGPGSVIVMNDTVDIIDVCIVTLQFFARESCGKCSTCREGIRAGLNIMNRFANNRAKPGDIKMLRTLRRLMYDTANCVLGQAALNATVSATKLFPQEFELRVRS